MIAVLAAAAVMSSHAHISFSGFLHLRAGDGPALEQKGELDVDAGKEGAALRIEASMGDDLMVRWVVVEPGHSYRIEQSRCAGVAFRDLAKPKRRPFVQVDASLLKDAAFPLQVMGNDGTELQKITWPDIGNAQEAQPNPACADSGSRVRVVDAKGATLLDEWIIVPNERVTRVTLTPGGGFTATAYDAFYIYFREDAARVDPVQLAGLRILGIPYSVRHTHGGDAAKIGMAMFEVKNEGKVARALSAKSGEMIRDFGTNPVTIVGVAFGEDESRYSPGGNEQPSVTIAPGEKKYVRVYTVPIDVYRSSINSTFRWSIVFECAGKTATATVPQEVMRVEPYRPRE